jgi:hypothetical protein
MLRRATLIAFLVALSLPAFAQTKIPVQITHTGKDTVGQTIVFHLREKIRGSNGMTLVGEEVLPRIRVIVVSLDDGDSDRDQGKSSVVAATFLYDAADIPLRGAFLTSNVQSCGRSRVASCAESLQVIIDTQVDHLRQNEPDLHRRLIRPK